MRRTRTRSLKRKSTRRPGRPKGGRIPIEERERVAAARDDSYRPERGWTVGGRGRPRGSVPLRVKIARAFRDNRTLRIRPDEFDQLRRLLWYSIEPARPSPGAVKKKTIVTIPIGASPSIDDMRRIVNTPNADERRFGRKVGLDPNSQLSIIRQIRSRIRALDNRDDHYNDAGCWCGGGCDGLNT